MSLSSLYLDAFKEVAKTESFSEAASNLHVTQSALSQRVKNLEEDLELTLFLRTPSGAVLTEQGQRLLRFCQTKDSLEEELVNDLSVQNKNELSGVIRIGAYSSVLRSIIIPALSPFLRENPKVLCEFSCAKMKELPPMLQRGEIDFMVLDYELKKSNLKSDLLGHENLISIQSKKFDSRDSIYLDNDTNDLATEMFFKEQKGKKPKYQRSYLDDCYGIIEGVEQGLGKAVMSEHLVKSNKKLEFNKKLKPVNLDVRLHYFNQPFYSKLHKTVIEELLTHSKKLLTIS